MAEQKLTVTRLKTAFQDRLDGYEAKLMTYPALLGDHGSTVEVSGRSGYVYVRIGNEQSVAQALNQRVPNRYDLPVIVGYDRTQPELFQVLSLREVYDGLPGNTIITQVPPHHKTHEWNETADDTVYVHLRQWLPLLVRPYGSAMEVQVDAGVLYRSGAWSWVSSQTLDLASYVPSLANQARYVLVYLDSSGTVGAEAGDATTKAAIALPDCPAPDSDWMPLAAVLCYTGQTTISDDNDDQQIVDLRFPQAMDAADTAGAISKALAWIDAEYDFILSRYFVEKAIGPEQFAWLEGDVDFTLTKHIVEG